MSSQDVVRCSECREVVRPEDLYCEACGAPVAAARAGSEPSRLNGPLETPVDASEGAVASTPEGDGREHLEIGFDDLAGISDRGLRRAHNEDALALARLQEHGARALVVCDGVSTSSQPADAAQAAAEAALGHLVAAVEAGRGDLEHVMKQAVVAAQDAVCKVPYGPHGSGEGAWGAAGEAPEAADEQGPPATTLVAAVLLPGKVTLGWVGDSRAYFVGGGEAWQLSHDDTWLEEVAVPSPAGEEGGRVALRAHVLTRWLGSDQKGEPEVSIATFLLPDEGCILLCSDGLWNYAPTPDQMRELVSGLDVTSTPLELTRGLVEFARAAGGADNITVAVAIV
jgi:serine/threonine protein phosphatase PrpC